MSGPAGDGIRTCPFSGTRSIIAGDRQARPNAEVSVAPLTPVNPEQDAFLEGHEAQTPPELDADRPGGGPADSPGWITRAIPNRYPMLRADAPDAEPEAVPQLFGASPARGAHEVIVQAPTPIQSLSELTPEGVARVVAMWQRRLVAHRGAPARHLIVNERPEAGASQPHTHAQLLALPAVPAVMARERERAEAYTLQTMGGNLTGDYLQEEMRRRDRVIAVDEECVLIAPWASKGAYHLTILPRRAALRLEDEPEGIGGRMVHEALRRLAVRFGAPPPLNLWVRTAVSGAERTSWRIELLPALTVRRGGVELGAELDVCTVAPELAAAELRDT